MLPDHPFGIIRKIIANLVSTLKAQFASRNRIIPLAKGFHPPDGAPTKRGHHQKDENSFVGLCNFL